MLHVSDNVRRADVSDDGHERFKSSILLHFGEHQSNNINYDRFISCIVYR